MATFDEREKGFESKFAHDQEFEFKVIARRNRLLGLWAAQEMGLTGEDAESYAKDVIYSDFDRAGDEDVFEKVWGDLQAKAPGVSEHQLRRQMEDLRNDARGQLKAE